MSHRIVVVLGSLAALALGTAAGCMIVTGSTDGYTEADGGDAAAPTVTSACPHDAATCVVDLCATAANCVASLGAGASCCAGVAVSGASILVGAACQTGVCSAGTIASCAADSDCEGGACMDQACSLAGESVEFRGCGLYPGCALVVPLDGGAGDGGGPADAGDASSSDAGDADIADASDSG
jgi:hypothetical protein